MYKTVHKILYAALAAALVIGIGVVAGADEAGEADTPTASTTEQGPCVAVQDEGVYVDPECINKTVEEVANGTASRS